MSQSLAKIWTHLVFSTKERYPFLMDQSIRHDLHAYLAQTLNSNKCPTLIVGGIADHVHALFVLSRNHSIANIVWEIKRSSSKWVETQNTTLQKFHWQAGYGAFSVSSRISPKWRNTFSIRKRIIEENRFRMSFGAS